jgi:hypothetical protein
MHDIVFISYHEPHAEENWNNLKSRFPTAKRVHGVTGIYQAHKAAAKRCFTKMFWVVDADAQLLDTFDFNYEVPEWDLDTVHVWRSKNPINDLEYGYGGVKLLPRSLILNMNVDALDMTTSISNKFKVMDQVSNITVFNTDEFSTWRSAFRECCKLSSGSIREQNDEETNKRLNIWCSIGLDRKFGKYAIEGAKAGRQYGSDNSNNVEALKKINDFEWLYEQFNKL